MRAPWIQHFARVKQAAVIAGYLAGVAALVAVLMSVYQPRSGFAYLISFGAKQGLPQVSELAGLDYLLEKQGYGYDAQYYAQIALHPSLRSAELAGAVDNLPYRARRILMCWTAYALGLGQPAWILQAYALQNVLAWFALAIVLLRWFPPKSWTNLLRWGGVLFCAGLCQSLRLALVDGPSLLLIALGVWCVETNRRWWATAALALAGLARETNVLGGLALVRPRERTTRHLAELAGRAVLIAAPLALWLLYVQQVAGPSLDAGARNFDLPLVAFFERWQHTITGLVDTHGNHPAARASLVMMIALTVQLGFLVLRPRLQEAWWRVGVAFAVLTLCLGSAVWEGYPGAVFRVVLPLQLAFNVLVPRRRRWLAVLVLGNLSVLAAPEFLQPPTGYGYRLTGPGTLVTSADGAESARVRFDDAWFEAESRKGRTWRWAKADAELRIVNPRPEPVVAAVLLYLDALDERGAALVRSDGEVLWRGTIAKGGTPIELPSVRLAGGDNVLRITTDKAPLYVEWPDPRHVAFSMRNLEVRFLRKAE